MPNLPKGTVIAWMECPCCEKESRILLNVNGNAYFTCKWPNTKTGNICMKHERWGKDASQQMQRDYLEHKNQPKEANTNGRPTERRTEIQNPANENSEPKPAAKEAGKAFYER